MSRLDGRAIRVVSTGPDGAPAAFLLPDSRAAALRQVAQVAQVAHVLDHWCEWVGALQGEPERSIWRVELEGGAICELHHRRCPTADDPDPGPESGDWLLYRWED